MNMVRVLQSTIPVLKNVRLLMAGHVSKCTMRNMIKGELDRTTYNS